MASNFLDTLFPPAKLTLILADQSHLTLTRTRKGIIYLDNDFEKSFSYEDCQLVLTAEEKHRISDGALAGAFASALMDRDILTGAIIGDWWEKQNDTKARKVRIILKDRQTKEERQIDLLLTYNKYQKVRRFFQRP
ncbi:hypothetical protein [Streptococcus loxodontisalivarius]|uniref:Uncharacterized protein n=1 Tax=Streptococcus loxodontisalivarius TaxID=1349415 RepID=A0ABS2PQL0_9STRE|nr:hypothetical protein [Streptococcus loxodontisalivarius]MBM7641995.1 hypothetical protein [Streptococcus loxodontisalivarius]